MASSPKKNAPALVPPALEGPDLAVAPPNVPDLAVAPPNVEEAATAVVEPAAEMQESVRTVVEKGVADTRAAFASAKATADEAANAFELSFAAAKDGMFAINAKALEALRANAESNFDFIKASVSAKSLSDLVALQGDFARKQFDAVTVQAKDIGALAQKSIAETLEPIKERFAKTFKIAV